MTHKDVIQNLPNVHTHLEVCPTPLLAVEELFTV